MNHFSGLVKTEYNSFSVLDFGLWEWVVGVADADDAIASSDWCPCPCSSLLRRTSPDMLSVTVR